MHQGACPTCPRTAHTCALALSQRCLPTESLPCGSRGHPAPHFELSWWCDLRPTHAHPPISDHAQYSNFFMSRSRALPAFVRSADLGVDRGLTGIRQAGACTTSFTSVLFPSAHQVHYTHLCCRGRRARRSTSTASCCSSCVCGCATSPRPQRPALLQRAHGQQLCCTRSARKPSIHASHPRRHTASLRSIPAPVPALLLSHGTAQLTPADPHLLLTSAPRPLGRRS